MNVRVVLRFHFGVWRVLKLQCLALEACNSEPAVKASVIRCRNPKQGPVKITAPLEGDDMELC